MKDVLANMTEQVGLLQTHWNGDLHVDGCQEWYITFAAISRMCCGVTKKLGMNHANQCGSRITNWFLSSLSASADVNCSMM
jgi:hypothetical protein